MGRFSQAWDFITREDLPRSNEERRRYDRFYDFDELKALRAHYKRSQGLSALDEEMPDGYTQAPTRSEILRSDVGTDDPRRVLDAYLTRTSIGDDQ